MCDIKDLFVKEEVIERKQHIKEARYNMLKKVTSQKISDTE